MFYRLTDNFEVIPSLYPWIINGALLREAFIETFHFDPGPLVNNTFCTNSTLVGCGKPGFAYDNYPLQPTNSLGEQDLDGIEMDRRGKRAVH